MVAGPGEGLVVDDGTGLGVSAGLVVAGTGAGLVVLGEGAGLVVAGEGAGLVVVGEGAGLVVAGTGEGVSAGLVVDDGTGRGVASSAKATAEMPPTATRTAVPAAKTAARGEIRIGLS